MPPGFALQFPINMQVDLWVPFFIDVADPDYHDRSNNFLYTVGRLKHLLWCYSPVTFPHDERRKWIGW